jgi:ribosome-associated protein
MSKKKASTFTPLLQYVIQGIQDKKGKEIVSLDLTSLGNTVCDYFVVCHGDSNTQVNAIAHSIEKVLHENLNEEALHKQGTQNAQWVLLDYGNVIVHIFQQEFRDFYKIEDLWADARIDRIADALNFNVELVNNG